MAGGAFKKQVVIAGGGASGLCAGIVLARRGFSVTVLEKTDTAGRKLSMTGNGRCNVSNLVMNASCYNENAAALAGKLLAQAGTAETIAFFRDIGVLLRNEEGYLYPVSGSAKQVVSAITHAFFAAGGRLLYNEQVKRVDGTGPFTVKTQGAAFPADIVILATGGLSGPKTTASTGDGYYIAKCLGMDVTECYPALVRLLSDDETLPADTGVRVRARVTFSADGIPFARECGEVQLTGEGLSGIPVLQASASCARALDRGEAVCAELDLFPDVTGEAWEALVSAYSGAAGHETLSVYLNGFSAEQINRMVLARAGLDPQTDAADTGADAREALLRRYRALRIPVTGTADHTKAQATAGGVSLDCLNDRLESLAAPGVYCTGELADVDGRCGGYNLQWAWTSALVVANDISSKYDQNYAN